MDHIRVREADVKGICFSVITRRDPRSGRIPCDGINRDKAIEHEEPAKCLPQMNRTQTKKYR